MDCLAVSTSCSISARMACGDPFDGGVENGGGARGPPDVQI